MTILEEELGEMEVRVAEANMDVIRVSTTAVVAEEDPIKRLKMKAGEAKVNHPLNQKLEVLVEASILDSNQEQEVGITTKSTLVLRVIKTVAKLVALVTGIKLQTMEVRLMMMIQVSMISILRLIMEHLKPKEDLYLKSNRVSSKPNTKTYKRQLKSFCPIYIFQSEKKTYKTFSKSTDSMSPSLTS